MLSGFGHQALISITSHLIFIALAWWALGAINYERLLRGNHVFQARVLYVLLSIVIGSTVSNFFLDYLLWSQQLPLILQLIYKN
ncbi:DUF1146 family protein [Bacillus sp. 31A1R]|uniref:DUF1146 family protein n=1 Tax=Robertmurraya mangrovi TaxID=3098077 RepID=A0ABU5IXD0_9BACI|nr:DUF1146 family protein [Bacillus sp. 31A1R]MDZ5471829.1 DUF1146 family protein [Bacillus sp. 31A1R]